MISYDKIDEAGILNAIRNSITHYKSNVKICDGYEFNMPTTVNKITLYSASKFETGDLDILKNKKYFYNIVNPLCDNASKNIDIDTKDIEARAEKVEDRAQSLIYNDQLKQWMKKNMFGSLLNDITDGLPKYGSVVLKKNKDKSVSIIELRHLYIDPSVSSKKGKFNIDSSYILEPHIMSIQEFQDMTSKWNPDAMNEINELIDERLKQGPANVPEIKVFECYMQLPNKLFLGEESTGNDMYLVFATINDENIANSDENLPDNYDTAGHRETLGIERVLFFKKGVKPLYKKLDYRTVVGRNLGYGVIESSFDAQERVNELKCDVAMKMRIGSNPIFFTKDKNMEENILTDTLPGDVIKANYEITPINLEMKDLGNYNSEVQDWTGNARNNTNANEASMGENMPSGTPWRVVQELSNATAKFFDLVKENVGLFIEDVLNDWILPEFEKEIKTEDTIMIQEPEIWQELLKYHVNYKLKNAIRKYVIQNGQYPQQQEIESLRQKLIKDYKGNPFVDINKTDYFDFKKKIYIDITGEKSNTKQRVESRINALQAIAQNPAILTNPVIWKLFAATMEDTGIKFNEVNSVENQPTPDQFPSTRDAGKTAAAAPGGMESEQALMNQ